MKEFIVACLPVWIFAVIFTILIVLIGVPIHEAGHVVACLAVGGDVVKIVWFQLPPAISHSQFPSDCYAKAGYVGVKNIPPSSDWLVSLAGGLFEGLFFLSLGVVSKWLFRRWYFARFFTKSLAIIVPLEMFLLGGSAILYGLAEMIGLVYR